MDYRTVEPPAWDTALPEEWSDKAHKARAMARNASHYAPELVDMFNAWANAWDARARDYSTWTDRAKDHTADAIAEALEGRKEEVRRSFAHAVAAAERARACSSVLYRSFLETIPNGEEFQGVAR